MRDKDVVNLRLARKAKKRADKKSQSDANAMKFGQRKTKIHQIKALKSLEDKKLDGHKRET